RTNTSTLLAISRQAVSVSRRGRKNREAVIGSLANSVAIWANSRPSNADSTPLAAPPICASRSGTAVRRALDPASGMGSRSFPRARLAAHTQQQQQEPSNHQAGGPDWTRVVGRAEHRRGARQRKRQADEERAGGDRGSGHVRPRLADILSDCVDVVPGA